MSDLKNMYKTILGDPFPSEMKVQLGDQELVYRKRTWEIEGEEKGLRYGENPDQPAAVYELAEGSLVLGGVEFRGPGKGLVSAITEENMLQAGKHPGKTNLTDVDNAINILQYLTAKPAALILKHNNPCGAAWSEKGVADALDKAFWSDRIAAFGGAVVVNRPMNMECARIINSAYFEVVAAPAFEEGVVEELKKRKNLRILEIPGMAHLEDLVNVPVLDFKSLIDGGLVMQQSFRNRILSAEDFIPATAEKDGVEVASRQPTADELDDLLFAWAVESGVTSNSIIFVRNGATVSIGTGEQDRVGCVELTIHKAYTKFADMLAFKEQNMSLYELKLQALNDEKARAILDDIEARTRAEKGGLMGTAMVSDGFFPFRDGVDAALAHGVAAIAQPGGSIRDHEVIEAVNEASPQVAMVFTGQRSFKH
ncbi:MAG: IMP cyclohydrolase [Desulfovibrionales bacterium]|nr:IMP cyclohydrolase [Desulfovibrionales bacterium]